VKKPRENPAIGLLLCATKAMPSGFTACSDYRLPHLELVSIFRLWLSATLFRCLSIFAEAGNVGLDSAHNNPFIQIADYTNC
jgi:hypothetical protein